MKSDIGLVDATLRLSVRLNGSVRYRSCFEFKS